jgi:hypothetical protein
MKRAVSFGLAVAVGLPLLAGCSRDEVRPGEARLEPHGVVETGKPGAAYRRVSKTTTIHDGDRVRVVSGAADVRLPKAALALRRGSHVTVGPSPELLAGDLLTVPSKQLTVRSAGSTYAVMGAARFQRRFAVTAASYKGAVAIRSAGSVLTVPALRQATVAALGEAPRTAEPLQYGNDDPWDRRFLLDAIELGTQLQSRADGANAQFRGQGTTPGFYRTLMPQLDGVTQFTSALLDASRPPGEHVVGAGIALAGKQGDFGQRWQRIFSFRGEGATWGLVAMDQDVERVPNLVKSIDDALGRARLPGQGGLVALGPTINGPAGPGLPTTPTSGGGPGTTNTSQGTTPNPPPTQPPIVTVPQPPSTGLPADPVIETAVDTINGLLPRKPG